MERQYVESSSNEMLVDFLCFVGRNLQGDALVLPRSKVVEGHRWPEGPPRSLRALIRRWSGGILKLYVLCGIR